MPEFPRALTIYLGSAGAVRRAYYDAATDLGIALASHGVPLVYGGMDSGTMGALADSVLEHGGNVTGIIPTRIRDLDRQHKGLSETVFVDDLWERKQLLFRRGEAIVIMPGGFGTLDEALEVLYWASLGLHDKKVVFVNIRNFWAPFLEFLATVPDLAPDSWLVVERPEALFSEADLPILSPRASDPESTETFPHFEDKSLCETAQPVILDALRIEDLCRFVTALIFRQLGKHQRPMGVLNRDGAFDGLLKWIGKAAHERFLTPKCPSLLGAARTEKGLMKKLESQGPVVIDLGREKWGEKS